MAQRWRMPCLLTERIGARHTQPPSLPSNCYVSLNAVGQRIWALLAQPHRLDALVAHLQDQFEDDQGAIRQDVEQFLRELETGGLVTLEPQSARQSNHGPC